MQNIYYFCNIAYLAIDPQSACFTEDDTKLEFKKLSGSIDLYDAVNDQGNVSHKLPDFLQRLVFSYYRSHCDWIADRKVMSS